MRFNTTQDLLWHIYLEGWYEGYSKIEASHHQVSVPVMLSITPFKIPLNFYGGGEVGYVFSGAVDIEYSLKDVFDGSVFLEGKSNYDYTNFMRDLNIGYVFGIGYNLSIVEYFFEVSIMYFASLNSLYDTPDYPNEMPPSFPLDTFINSDMYQNELIFSIGVQLN